MVQREKAGDSTRLKLVSLLPRLRRFAGILAGDRAACDSLLRTACQAMLADSHRFQRGTPFDRWAFAELYAHWLEALRDHDDPIAQGRGDGTLFLAAFSGAAKSDGEIVATVGLLAKLPPQQRSAALLVYGEGFSYEDAALILDTTPQTVIERAARALSAHIGLTGPSEGAAGQGAPVASLYPNQRQAS